jgi:hypothetical protein
MVAAVRPVPKMERGGVVITFRRAQCFLFLREYCDRRCFRAAAALCEAGNLRDKKMVGLTVVAD